MNIKERMVRIAEVVDKSFLSPSVYAVVLGAFIGVATNLFALLISAPYVSKKFILLAISLLIVSAGSFLYVCLASEYLQKQFSGIDLFNIIKGKKWRKRLWASAFIGCASFIMSMCVLACII